MEISSKAKSIIKKVALVLAGITAITAVAFGVKAIVDYTKNDLKEINPGFEVGNLGSDGKYVADEGSLYTKEAFGCYGLQVKPEFDSTVNYQLFYYDILDNYISSSEVLSAGYSAEAPLNGAYARMVIMPRNDEDGKIGVFEKQGYVKQLNIKVKKEQKIKERYTVYNGQVMQVVFDLKSTVFKNNYMLDKETHLWSSKESYAVTAATLLNVRGGSTINYDLSQFDSHTHSYCYIFQYSDMPSEECYIGLLEGEELSDSLVLSDKTKYIIIVVDEHEFLKWDDSQVAKFPSCFSITK